MGANLGGMASGAFFPKTQRVQLPTQKGPRLADLRAQTSTYGNMIPKIYGTMRLAGNVIWSSDLEEVKSETTTTQTSSGGGKGGGGGSVTTSQTTVTYQYFVTLTIAMCEGPVDEVIRVWADSKVLTEDVLFASQGKYNVHLGDETQDVDDIILDRPITVRSALEYLVGAYFFDIVESDGLLKCVPRGSESVESIAEGNLVPTAKKGIQNVLEINYAQELELPQRVIKTDMESNGMMKVSAIAEDVSSYDFYTPPGETSSTLEPPVLVPDTIVRFVDAPLLPTDTVPNQGLLRIGVAADGNNWNGAAIYRSDDGGEAGGNTFNLLAGMDGVATFGAIITPLPAGPFEVWDDLNEVEVILTSGSLGSISELGVLNGANAALIGDELVQFQNAQLIGEKTYKLTRLLRGRQGTEWAMEHVSGEPFVLISPALYTITIANNFIGRELFYKAVSVGNSLSNTDENAFTYTGRNLHPYAPVHVKGTRNAAGDLAISWIRRSRVDAEWRDGISRWVKKMSAMSWISSMVVMWCVLLKLPAQPPATQQQSKPRILEASKATWI
jgi:hypothetical protein